MKSVKVYIYGLFSRCVCNYVGATLNPEARKRTHRFNHPSWRFKVLEVRSRKKSNNLERKWIAAFKANGEARHNIQVGSRIVGVPGGSGWFVRCSNGMSFPSVAEAARSIGVPASTLFRNHNGKRNGLTFKKLALTKEMRRVAKLRWFRTTKGR